MARALGSGNELAPADLPHQLHLLADLAPIQVHPVTMGVGSGNRPPVEFAEQDVCQSLQNRRWRSFQDVGYLDRQASPVEAYGAVGVGIPSKYHLNLRKSGA